MELATCQEEQPEVNLDDAKSNVVKYIAECIIKHDLDVIIMAWLRFRIERSTTPVERLGELFRVIMRNELVLEIHTGDLILFENCPETTKIPLGALSSTTKNALIPMLKFPQEFYEDIDGIAIQYISLKRFKYNNILHNTQLWNEITTHYIKFMLRYDINMRYLKGRGVEIVLIFVTDEIAYHYDTFTAFAKYARKEWVAKKEKYISTIELIYKELNKSLR